MIVYSSHSVSLHRSVSSTEQAAPLRGSHFKACQHTCGKHEVQAVFCLLQASIAAGHPAHEHVREKASVEAANNSAYQ